ncbi:MAG TPA: hypothetical protein VGP72_13470 [Planctomycetota bacterium]|jgi:hypothetical protein
MELIITLVVLSIVGIFILGLITACRLLVQALRGAEPEPYRAPPPPPPPVHRTSSRQETLQQLEREVNAAFYNGQISKETYRDMRAFLEHERASLGYAPAQKPARSATSSPPRVFPARTHEIGAEKQAPITSVPPAAPEPDPLTRKIDDQVTAAANRLLDEMAGAPKMDAAKAPESPHAEPGFKPERVRAAMARLQADSAAPTPPVAEEKPAAAAESLEAVLGVAHTAAQVVPASVPAGRDAGPTPAGRDAGTTPALASGAPRGEGKAAAPARPVAPAPVEPRKSLAERLFTPENARIFLGLGIFFIFISSVALVRTKMWDDASPQLRMTLLLAGTGVCSALGFVLRRWTSLRVTALGFLILGQLALMLDTYAALIRPAGQSLYPYSPESLWTIAFVTFTALSLFQARMLKEPLFDAFTFFGGLTSWGIAVVWAGVDPLLVPAAFVPAAFLCAGLSRWLTLWHGQPLLAVGCPCKDASMLQRWSLPWWLDAGWQIGSRLLAIVLPIVIIAAGNKVGDQYWYHAGAIAAIAIGLLASARRSGRPDGAYVGCLQLLSIAPLAAYVFGWSHAAWSAVFAVPGAVLVLGAALGSWLIVRSQEPRAKSHEQSASSAGLLGPIFHCGMGSALIGVAAAVILRLSGQIAAPLAWSAAAGLVAALVVTLKEDVLWGPWLATICATLLMVLGFDLSHQTSACWPFGALLLALVSHAGWSLRRDTSSGEQGAVSADTLAVAAGIHLAFITPWLAGAVVPGTVAAGWGMLAAYALATALWTKQDLRLGLGTALLSPALAFAFYHFGYSFTAPAPWLAVLAMAAMSLGWFFDSRRQASDASGVHLPERAALQAVLMGAGPIILHGTVLAFWHWVQLGASGSLAAMLLLALAVAEVAFVLRGPLTPNPSPAGTEAGATGRGEPGATDDPTQWKLADLVEIFSTLLLAGGGYCVAAQYKIGLNRPELAAVLAVGIVVIAYAEQALGSWLLALGRKAPSVEQLPFRIAGGAVALLLTGVAFVGLLGAFGWVSTASQLITCAWASALLPLWLGLGRPLPWMRQAETQGHDSATVMESAFGIILALLLSATAAGHALWEQFWLFDCPARGACALFFGVTLAVSLAVSVWLKRGFGPVSGMLALLGLAGCAYGQWHLPSESFGLCCAVLAWLAAGVSRLAARGNLSPGPSPMRGGENSSGQDARGTNCGVAANLTPQIPSLGGKGENGSVLAMLKLSAAGVAALGAVFLIAGLALWPRGGVHMYAVFAWAALAALGEYKFRKDDAGGYGLAAMVFLSAMVLHILRWCGLAFERPETALILAAAVVLIEYLEQGVLGSWLLALSSWPASGSRTDKGDEPARRPAPPRPFRSAAGIVAVGLSGLAYVELLGVFGGLPTISRFITCGWIAALLPLWLGLGRPLSLTPQPPSLGGKGETDDLAGVEKAFGIVIAILLAGTVAGRALWEQFWLPVCPTRDVCALFFGVSLLVSLLGGVWLRRGFGPVTGMLALLGLIGCAYGQWNLPPESFGLCCIVLACAAAGLNFLSSKSQAFASGPVPGMLSLSATGVATLGVLFLLVGLVLWPAGSEHRYAVIAWAALAALAGMADRKTGRKGLALASMLCVTATVLHALRWSGMEFNCFGPALGVLALLQLALAVVTFEMQRASAEREEEPEAGQEEQQEAGGGRQEAGGTARSARSGALDAVARIVATHDGRVAGAIVSASLSLVVGVVGMVFHQHAWLWCATLAENAILLAALVVVRLRANAPGEAQSSGAVVYAKRAPTFLLEIASWAFLALAVGAACSEHAANIPLSGAAWIFVAAIFLAIGMVAESIVGALTPHDPDCKPYLASRHVAALVLTGFGLCRAFVEADVAHHGGMEILWRAIFSAAALAVYGSMANCCVDRKIAEAVRKISAFVAYVVLIPAGYLCFLAAHATGSSYGALYFLALAPVLIGIAYAFKREESQCSYTLLGAGVVNAGALVLSYAGNRAFLAAVPCATLAAIVAQFVLLHFWQPLRAKTAGFSVGASLAFVAAAFYGVRALAGVPAWGVAEPWVWEMPLMAALGLLMTSAGGVFIKGSANSEIKPAASAVVAHTGACVNVLALIVTVGQCLFYGSIAGYLERTNTARLDGLIVCLLLFSANAFAAGRWLGFGASRFVSPAALIAAYSIEVWKLSPTWWEWYTAPIALFLFAWAWQNARRKVDGEQLTAQRNEVSTALTAASVLGLAPSFIQGLPDTTVGLQHALLLLGLGLAVVFGAMLARRRIPLLAGSSAVIAGMLCKAVQWAHHKEITLPVLGILLGCGVLALGMLFESRVNKAFKQAVDRAKAEAKMFWMKWE